MIKFKLNVLRIAVLAAIPLVSSVPVYAASTCAYIAGDVTCTGTGAENSVVFNANVPSANSSFIGTSGNVSGKTINILSDSTITGSAVNNDGTLTGGSQLNKVGVYLYNGLNSEDNPSYDVSKLGGLVQDASFNNLGTTINNRGAITINSPSMGTNTGFGSAGILVSGSNNTINNLGTITLTSSANTVKQWGILIDNSAYETSGNNYNNLNNVVNNYGTINVSNSYVGTLSSSSYTTGVTFKEAVIDEVLNNYGTIIADSSTASGSTTGSNKYVFAIYSDDNAGSVTVNNYHTITASTDATLLTPGTSTSGNAAVFLRAFSANLNNYQDAVINGNVMTRSTNAGFGLYNAGTINGSFVRYLGGADADATLADSQGNWDGHFTDTYQPVITAAGHGIINGSFVVKQESTSNTNTFVSDLWIKPTLSGAVVHQNDSFVLLGNGGTFQIPITSGHLLTYKVNDDVVTNLSTQAFTYSSGLVDWEISLDGQGLATVTNVKNASVIPGVTRDGAVAVNALMTANSVLGGQVQNLATVEEVRSASEQLRPEINGATTQASMNVTGKLQDLVGSRLDQIHLASVAGRSGIATGDETRTADGTGVWMQAFGGKGSQDRRENTDGYNTQAYGFAVGADQLVDDETRVGFVGSFGQSTVNGLGDGVGNRTSIDSYQGAIYGSTLLRKLYVNGTVGLGYHDYTNSRFVLANSIKGSHDAWQGSAKLDVGYPVKMNAVTLVPVASLAYSHLAESGYTESGVGALAISSRGTDSFKTGLGAKAMIPLMDNAVSAGLELRAIWNHEFGDSNIDTTARFVEGGASFTTNGVSLERDSANLGASLRLSGVMDGVKQSLNVNYDAEVKSQYLNQTASLQARFDF